MFRVDPVDRDSIATIFQAASPRHVASAALIVLLGTIVNVGAPVVFGWLIDGLESGNLIFPAVLFALYALAFALSRFLADVSLKVVELIELDVIFHAGTRLFDALLRKKASLTHHYQSGFMVESVKNMQDSYGIYVFLVFMTLVPPLIEAVVSAFVVATVIDWQTGLLVLSYAGVIVVLTYMSNHHVKDKQEKAIESLAESAEVLGDVVGSFQVVKAAQAGPWYSKLYRARRQTARQAFREFHRIRLRFAFGRTVALAVQLVIMFFFSIRLYQSGEITVGEIVIFNGLILQLNRPAELIAGSIEDLLTARQLQAGYKTILDYPELQALVTNDEEQIALQQARSDESVVWLDKVSFAYDPEKPVFVNLSASFDLGRINFIVGPSGSGKTTILRLLLRFQEDYEGMIRLAGRDIRTYDESELYSLIGYVPQSPDIVAGTLADNVTLGRDVCDKDILDALEKVGLAATLTRLDEGIHTPVGRRGVVLSGGEMQRVAIARAILQKPLVLLLDEPSSALDQDTERNIFQSLRELGNDLAIIAVTHRTWMVSDDDLVVDVSRFLPVKQLN